MDKLATEKEGNILQKDMRMHKNELTNNQLLLLRKKAEQILQMEKSFSDTAISNVDQQSLIYELQIHQIELEMQNDELRKAQEIIENSRKRYSDLYNYAPVGYFTTDLNGVIVEANMTALNFLKYEKINVIGKPLAVFVNKKDHDLFYRQLQLLRSGQSYICEILITRYDKSSFYAEFTGVPFIDNRKKAHQFLIAVSDISIRRHAVEIRSQLASIVDGTDDAIISEKLDGTIISWNKGAEKMYGFTEKEICGKNITILTPERTDNKDPEPRSENRKFVKIEHYESIHQRKDGSHFPMSLTISPVRGENEEVSGVSTIVRDITVQKKWEETILELNKQFQSSNQNLENIASTLSHELRGPLQGIIGLCLLLKDECVKGFDENCRKFLRQIHCSAVNMDEMVVKLLEISRVSRVNLDYQTIDLSELVVSIVNEYGRKEPLRNIKADIKPGLCVEGDKTLLHIAIEKIVQNAFKFTRKKNIAQIEFGVCENRAKMAYFLRDNGAGFDMKYKDKLFNILQRLHQDSEYEGSGIGLSTAQKIIQRHDGEIWAEGDEGIGATFYFTLGK